MLVTAAVFHESPLVLIFWLKAEAPANILCIVVTDAVFQEDISWSKIGAL